MPFIIKMWTKIAFAPTIMQEMTLEEYEKVLEEKRKALLALKTEERKVEIDKELRSMQQLSVKKNADEVFIKLVSFAYAIISSSFGSAGFYLNLTSTHDSRALTRT